MKSAITAAGSATLIFSVPFFLSTASLRHVRLSMFLYGLRGMKILEGGIGNAFGPPSC